jgi:hypothetical protein
MEHHVKTWPPNFNRWINRETSSEIRRDDRKPPYTAGDILVQEEWDPVTKKHTGRVGIGRIFYVHRVVDGLDRRFCIVEAPFEKMRITPKKEQE